MVASDMLHSNNNTHVPPPDHPVINPKNYDDLLTVVSAIRAQVDVPLEAEIGIICGSGLGVIGDQVENPIVIPYSKIPGFPVTNVPGHKGNLLFGTIAGKKVVCMQGRFHPYEHQMNTALCALPVRVMHQFGIKTMIVSNAAGGINKNFQYGDLMLIKDHIFLPGLAGHSPLIGLKDPRYGRLFTSLHDAYNKDLRNLAIAVANAKKMRLFEGVFVMSGGPQYESPAEVNMFKTVGADALGMSTCHEVIVARQCGITCLGFSLITNIANLNVENSVEVSHAEVLETAKEAGERASSFVCDIIANM
ncbi:unnamed protein product [Caenorhabditis auriculariae]|uniref:Purine nucleoside phosphorylase n=1 Tax=Caenorhabditis auriculariae TaxID=2777116 RepID=A0A8S1HUM8_9PELO|nr:unnamed protein product [Caenorhabditis auriculariae]